MAKFAPALPPSQGSTPVTRLLLALLCIAALDGTAPAQTWHEIIPREGPAPKARYNASAIYDPVDHRMVLFGGRTSTSEIELNDVWSFGLSEETWTEITPDEGPSPVPRSTHNAVYDPVERRMLVWSGQKLKGGSEFFNDVWSFDLTQHTWSLFEPPDPRPNVRYGTAAVFDPRARSLVTFAGFTDEGRFDDTWAFDPDGNSWTDISPPGSRPLKRCLHHAVYDRRGHSMIIYGGQSEGAQKDIWAFDLEEQTWTELTPEDSPSGRWYAAAVYDARNHRFLMFGGNRGGDAGTTDEVWTFDLQTNAWTLLQAQGAPPIKRTRAAAVYVESEDRMVVFGGAEGTSLDDMWSLEGLSPATAVENQTPRPDAFSLEQNYPNPCNSSTTIHYSLAAAARVDLRIHDVLGRPVRHLAGKRQEAGAYTAVWDGTDDRGRPLASGVYFYRLSTGMDRQTRRLVLLR